MPIDIRKAEPMLPTRPCRYCLALQDDRVFADFDLDDDGLVVLVAISFDGYGYCGMEKVIPMDAETSESFKRLVDSNLHSKEMSKILRAYFRENSDLIWRDALEARKLLFD